MQIDKKKKNANTPAATPAAMPAATPTPAATPPPTADPATPAITSVANGSNKGTKVDLQTAYLSLIAGLLAYFQPGDPFALAAGVMTRDQLIALFQQFVAAAEATKSSNAVWRSDVQAERAMEQMVAPVRAGLTSILQAEVRQVRHAAAQFLDHAPQGAGQDDRGEDCRGGEGQGDARGARDQGQHAEEGHRGQRHRRRHHADGGGTGGAGHDGERGRPERRRRCAGAEPDADSGAHGRNAAAQLNAATS